MKRTQLYIEDDLWAVLRIRSRQSGVSISELMRQAIRDRYPSGAARRQEAMRAVVGIWKDRSDLPDTESYVRRLRKGSRIKRVAP
ncbi:MAG: ribbon-helix-helix domain-containing protein [Acidobacteria bacterium]|nr:ribbon-helix-helix domain-containing protein [Acidobacteriota bacterium]